MDPFEFILVDDYERLANALGPSIPTSSGSGLRRTCWQSAVARDEFQEAIRLLGRGDAAEPASLLVRSGRVEMTARRYDAAEGAFNAAEELLGERRWE